MAAYQSGKKKEHAFQTIGKDLKVKAIPNVVMLCGEEQYLVEWAAKQLIDTFINAIFLYDDKMVLTFNFREGTETITFADLQAALQRSVCFRSGGLYCCRSSRRRLDRS